MILETKKIKNELLQKNRTNKRDQSFYWIWIVDRSARLDGGIRINLWNCRAHCRRINFRINTHSTLRIFNNVSLRPKTIIQKKSISQIRLLNGVPAHCRHIHPHHTSNATTRMGLDIIRISMGMRSYRHRTQTLRKINELQNPHPHISRHGMDDNHRNFPPHAMAIKKRHHVARHRRDI